MKKKRRVLEPTYDLPPLDSNHREQEEEIQKIHDEYLENQAHGAELYLSTLLWKKGSREIRQLSDGRIMVRGRNTVFIWPAGTLPKISPFSDGEPLPENYRPT